MERSGLQLRAVSPRQGGEIAARRPSPAALFARPPYASEPRDGSSALSTYREDHRGDRFNPHDRVRNHQSDVITIIDRGRDTTQMDWERERAHGPFQRRGNERLARQLSFSSENEGSIYSDSSTIISSDGEDQERSPSPGPPAEKNDHHSPGISSGSTQKQPKLALFSRADKGLLGPPESEAAISTTISRDNTAGERARHASLFADYGRKIKPKGQPGAGLPRSRPSPSLAPRPRSRPRDDLRADRSPSPAQEENNGAWSTNLSERADPILSGRLEAAREYIRRAREMPQTPHAARPRRDRA